MYYFVKENRIHVFHAAQAYVCSLQVQILVKSIDEEGADIKVRGGISRQTPQKLPPIRNGRGELVITLTTKLVFSD